MRTTLPVHFIWSDGTTSRDLAQLQQAITSRSEEAGWHLAEGHLQHALSEQGYRAVVEDCAKAKHLELLSQRVEVVLSLASEATDDGFARTVAGDKLFKKGKAELTAVARKALAQSLDDAKPKAVKKTAKRAAKEATGRITKVQKAKPAAPTPAKSAEAKPTSGKAKAKAKKR